MTIKEVANFAGPSYFGTKLVAAVNKATDKLLIVDNVQ